MKQHIKIFFIKSKQIIGNVAIIITLSCCEDQIDEINILDKGVVINEINYNSTDNFDSDDWVEIYNNSNDTIDIGSWLLKDEDDDHIFTAPSNIKILPEQYIIFCKDTIKLTELFPDVESYYGNLGFGLSGGSDLVRLFDNTGSLVDTVRYDDDDPWPLSADGNGPTLELKHPTLDNALWESWSASEGYGTPGAQNSVFNDDL